FLPFLPIQKRLNIELQIREELKIIAYEIGIEHRPVGQAGRQRKQAQDLPVGQAEADWMFALLR
ncbi:MAG: hypothetical protein M1482_05295, partial [Chloroflexi bacterium]|nr:hypothetical protein [Chloroflexota bacterium]